MAKKSNFKKYILSVAKIIDHRKNVRHTVKCQYFVLQIFILFEIFREDSLKKIVYPCYNESQILKKNMFSMQK